MGSEIRNDGPLIESTNYWATDLAAKGMFYISWNAKTARLLVPPSQAPAIPEMETAEYVIITRGPWADAGGRMAWELLFEDNSDTPYALHILAEQSDRQVPPSDMGRHILFSAWGPDRLLFKRPARLRSAARLPYLKPWETP